MRIIRFLGNVALWFGALLGVVAGGVWIADQLGWVQPLIVISGSMEPNIGTGDLLISRNLATDDVEVGDVVSLHSELTDKLVTHRVTEVASNDDGTWSISMKGDANDEPDLETYVVGDSVLTPALQIPQGGKVVSKIMEPAVALPILLSLVALLGLSLLDEPARPTARARDEREDEFDEDLDADDLEPDPIGELDAVLAAFGASVTPAVARSVAPSVDSPLDDVTVDAPVDARVDDLDAALAALGIDVERELAMSG